MPPAKDSAPRRLLDWGVTDEKDYIPLIFPNGDFVFRSRSFSILNIKVGKGNRSRRPGFREAKNDKMRAFLQSKYGLSSNHSRVLLSRRVNDIKRIEDCVHGILDSLLLFSWELFYEEKPTIRSIIRKILVIGPYNLGQIVKYWKEFNNFLYNRAAEILPAVSIPPKENFFWKYLSSNPLIQRILNSDIDKQLAERFAHLSSSRQLPTGDRNSEKSALDGFFRNIEAEYSISDHDIHRLREVSTRIGEKCLSFGKVTTYPHISLGVAGSYYATTKDGGRGKEIREALMEILTVRPVVDESISTPFGVLRCPEGEERWRYWCREDPYTWYKDTPFGSPIEEEVFAEQNLYFQGFDEAIGSQIFVVSYLEYLRFKRQNLPIPCRCLTVPEPGYKSRIVTTGPFWLNTLQQGLSHYCKDILKNHPSSRSSLQKTDQAWQSLYLMSNKQYPEGSACLSSDLKEATDHVPKVVAVQLLLGFLQGVGLCPPSRDLVIDLIQMDREFVTDYDFSLKQTRGIMMGEPITKSILTLLNLVVEELAMRDHLGIGVMKKFFTSPKWRTYHIGGDDHIAIGPVEYLKRITANHLIFGSKISEGKHGISRNLVFYTEKVIFLKNLWENSFDVRRINDSTEAYRTSPFTDSVKVRLLSPLIKSMEVISDRNVAIGKGLSLGRSIKWLNPDHFSIKWRKMVRARFFQRMGSLLPDRSSGVFWQLLLPIAWGGLDLYFPDEVEEIIGKIPLLTKSIMLLEVIRDPRAFSQRKLLSKLLSNYSFRGFKLKESEVAAMRSHIETVITQLPIKYWWELRSEYDPKGEVSARTLVDLVSSGGWHAETDLVRILQRPILFKEILLGVESTETYNTEPLKMRYSKLWDLIYSGGGEALTIEEFREALKLKEREPFYKVDYPEEIHFKSDRGYLYKSALDDALHGMPVLKIGFPFC
jgi:hypothetical protein